MNIFIGDLIRAIDDSPALFVYSINLTLKTVYAIDLYNLRKNKIDIKNLCIYEKINNNYLDEVEKFYLNNNLKQYIRKAKLNYILNES